MLDANMMFFAVSCINKQKKRAKNDFGTINTVCMIMSLYLFYLTGNFFQFLGGVLGKLFCVQYICISIYNSSLRIFKVCSIQKMGFIKLSTDGFFHPAYCLYRIPCYCTCKVRKNKRNQQ